MGRWSGISLNFFYEIYLSSKAYWFWQVEYSPNIWLWGDCESKKRSQSGLHLMVLISSWLKPVDYTFSKQRLQRKENYKQVWFMNSDVNILNKILVTRNPTIYENSNNSWLSRIYHRNAKKTIRKSIKVMYHNNRLKEKYIYYIHI